MSGLKLYPAIDLLDGACVRLAQGRFEEKTVYSTDPLEVAARFAAQGARALHIVDLSGAKDPARRQTNLLSELLAQNKLEVQVGGGVRALGDARELLDAGATRVVIGSLAISDPAETVRILEAISPARVTLALDVRADAHGTYQVAIRGWQETSAVALNDAIERYAGLGVKQFLCTDVSRDGMLQGPNVELYREISARYPEIELQASGGVRDLNDLRALREAKVPAAILGRSIYAGTLDLAEALAC